MNDLSCFRLTRRAHTGACKLLSLNYITRLLDTIHKGAV